MADEADFEAQRSENIRRNQALLDELGLKRQVYEIGRASGSLPPSKRRRTEASRVKLPPTRTSARIASASVQPKYKDDAPTDSTRHIPSRIKKLSPRRLLPVKSEPQVKSGSDLRKTVPPVDVIELQKSWSTWSVSAPEPSRDVAGAFHFDSHPDFTPNKSPEEVIREGCFGGSYFRPLFSRTLGVTISDDWKELPSFWVDGLNTAKFLDSPHYDADVNKFKVSCGQSIEEWEAAGWINHNYDVRGWFQWYCRFYMGRRCDDDERQVSRWKKCVGSTGRWKRMLLKKYVSAGVRDVFDDGEEEGKEVSPVMHQTCHHWAYCVTQEDLDEHWESVK